MLFNLQKTKVTALPDISGGCQVYDGGKFVVLLTSKKDGKDISGLLIIRNFFKKIQELTEKISLRDAIKKEIDELKKSLGDIQIAAVYVNDDFVHAVSYGGGEVFIYRNGSMASILKSVDQNLVSAKGKAMNQDVVILGTEDFFKQIDYVTLKDAIEKGGPIGAAGEIEEKFNQDGAGGQTGGYFVKFVAEEEQEIEEAPSPLPQEEPKQKKIFTPFFSFFKKLIPDKPIFVRNVDVSIYDNQSKKTTLSVGIILIFILLVSIVFGIRQKNINNQKARYEDKLSQAQHLLDEAIGLTGVSADRARELFGQSENLLKEIQELKVKDERIDKMALNLSLKRGEVLGEYTNSPELYLDLTLLTSGFNSDYVAVTGENMFLLDKTNKKLINIEIENKKSKVVAGSDKIDKVDGLAAYDDRAFILNDEGIFEVGQSVRKVLEKDWEDIPLIHAFAGNLYLLAKDSNSIYRYSGQTDQTFGNKYDWLSKGVDVDFSYAKSWSLDGAVYVLTSTGKIVKFSRGVSQSFSVGGVYPVVSQIENIYANEANEYFYLLDKEGKRVVVLTKSGDYKAQYVNDKIGEAKALVVSEKDKKILLLTGSKIFSIEIKHL